MTQFKNMTHVLTLIFFVLKQFTMSDKSIASVTYSVYNSFSADVKFVIKFGPNTDVCQVFRIIFNFYNIYRLSVE